MAALADVQPGSRWTVEQLSRFCDCAQAGPGARDLGLVAAEASRVLAFILVSCVLDEAEILNLVVAAGARRRGIGRQLLGAALATLGDRGVRRCHLEVRNSNEAAIGLYRSAGFTENGRRKGYYRSPDGAGEDALMMLKSLPGTGL
jgi:ribosomal-protein-alanine N-acetyltransferase